MAEPRFANRKVDAEITGTEEGRVTRACVSAIGWVARAVRDSNISGYCAPAARESRIVPRLEHDDLH